MEETPKIVQMAQQVREETERLLEKHYTDNRDIIERSIAWKQKAESSDSEERISTRSILYTLCAKQGDVDMQPEERAEIIAESVIFWSETFGYVNSPKTKNKHLPLAMFPFQKDLIKRVVLNIERGSDGLIEKSREMGVSWMVMFVYTWYWLFKPGTNMLIGSYKESLVTDGTIDSMFGKISYILDGLPKWLMPRKYNKLKHLTRKRIENPELGNYITGDTMNAQFGRGARKTSIFFDELGFWDYAKSAWEACGETTDTRIGNSTPNGYNYYKMLIDSGLDCITLHWKQHPLKGELWYEYKKMKDTPDSVAREIDISYDASKIGIIYSDWRLKIEKGYFEYDEQLPLYVAWDFGNTDGTAIIWSQIKNGQLVVIDSFYKTGQPMIDFFAPIVTGRMLTEFQYNYNDDELDLIARHGKWKTAVHFGDPAGKQQHQGMVRSVIDTLKIYGINVNTNAKKIDHKSRRTDAQKLIHRGVLFNDIKDNKWLDLSMMNYSYMSSKVDGVNQVMANAKPRHDQYSHMATAFEYLAVGLADIKPVSNVRVRDKFSGSATGLGKKRKIRIY